MIIVVIIITVILLYGLVKKVPCFDTFLEGARSGIATAIQLFPTLLALFVAIQMLLHSGIIDILSILLQSLTLKPTIFLQMLLKPLSGNASLILFEQNLIMFKNDAFNNYYTTLIQSSSDTTIYLIIVYFGSINITKINHTLWAGLLVDLLTYISAFLLLLLFFI